MGNENNNTIAVISLIDRIINVFLSVIMSFCISFELITILQFPYKENVVFLIILLTSFTFFLMLYNKKTIFISLILCSLIALSLFICCLLISSFRIGTFDFFSWFYRYIFSSANLDTTYIFYAMILLCVIISFAVYLLVVNKLWFITLIVGTIIFVVSTQQMLPFSFSAFYIFDIAALLYYFRYIYTYNCKKGVNKLISQLGITLWLVPICLLIFTVSFYLPSSQYPVQFKWLDDKINSYIQENSSITFDDFNINKAGFGNSSTLGGIADPNSMKSLAVKASKPIYLKGSILDNYTGSAWINSDKKSSPLTSTNNENSLQNYEVQEGVNFLPQIEININTKNKLIAPKSIINNTYINYDTIQVTYKQINTKTIFSSNGLTNLFIKKDLAYINANGGIKTLKSHTKNFQYQMDTYNFKYGDKTFQNILRASKSGIYNANINSYDSKVRNLLKSRADAIYAKYLKLPKNLPKRVTDLAKSITSTAENNYDKVKMIETYLASNMKYTTKPPEKPSSQDFVDFFLFDSKTGYCTYYATSMTVLVRSLGIPARYVEGFVMPNEKDSNGLYIVTNEQAHAWVEVYFEGVGWVQFEPTTIYTQSFYANSLISSVKEIPTPIDGELGSSGSTLAEEFTVSYSSSSLTSSSSSSSSSSSLTSSTKTHSTNLRLNILFIILFICFVFIIIIALFFINNFRVSKRISNAFQMEPRQSIITLYNYYLKLFALIDLPIKTDETASEFAKRVTQNSNYYKFEDVTQIFILAKYSRHIMTERDKESLINFYYPFISHFKSTCKTSKYILYHYIFGKI
jgi:hypothetical protein